LEQCIEENLLAPEPADHMLLIFAVNVNWCIQWSILKQYPSPPVLCAR